jgi:hypothetical protein
MNAELQFLKAIGQHAQVLQTLMVVGRMADDLLTSNYLRLQRSQQEEVGRPVAQVLDAADWPDGLFDVVVDPGEELGATESARVLHGKSNYSAASQRTHNSPQIKHKECYLKRERMNSE